jgi:lysophospholipase L1-like esterase
MIVRLAAALVILAMNVLQPVAGSDSTDSFYIALGDSVAAGIGSSLPRDRSYPSILGELFSSHSEQSIRTLNLAEPGESAETFLSDGQLDAFRSAVADIRTTSSNIEAVTLTLGGNDVLDLRAEDTQQREEALATFRTSMPEAIRAIVNVVGSDTPIYVSTVYDPTGEDPSFPNSDAWWIEQFNSVIRDAVAAAGVTLVDLAVTLGPEAQDLTRYPADVHPTNEGHSRLATEFWRATNIDHESPEISILSGAMSNRFTPTLRFEVGPDTVLNTIVVSSADDRAIVYPPVETSDLHFAVLIDASEIQTESLEILIEASDAAGNATQQRILLTFSPSR